MQTRRRIVLGASLVAALAAGTLGLVAVRAQEQGQDFGALVKDLGNEKFESRTKAYEALESAGAQARKALEEGAKSEDAQVRWSARRLLHRLDGEDRAPLRVLRFGEDAGGTPGLPDMDRAFRDMDRRMEELRRQFEGLRGAFRFEVGPDMKGAKVERHGVADLAGERIDARVDADGKVTVKIGTKGPDGKTTEETFEAKDMEALEKENPEVAKKVKGLLGERIEIRTFGGSGMPDLYQDLRGTLRDLLATAKPALGVTVSDVPPVLRTQLSMKEGEGIVIEEVLPDTPAARLGLKRHDVVLSVNGIPVSTAAEVRTAVAAVKEGGALALRILRGGKAEEVAGTR